MGISITLFEKGEKANVCWTWLVSTIVLGISVHTSVLPRNSHQELVINLFFYIKTKIKPR